MTGVARDVMIGMDERPWRKSADIMTYLLESDWVLRGYSSWIR